MAGSAPGLPGPPGGPSRWIEEIDVGRLVRVLAVGTVATAGDIEVEFHSVEIRESGGFASFRVEDRRPEGRGATRGAVHDFSPPDVDLMDPAVRIEDDLGTRYVALPTAAEGANLLVWRHRFAFAPAPPRDARRLYIHIDRFGASMHPPRVAEGPWSADAPL